MEMPSKDVRTIIKATFPNYRRKTVLVEIAVKMQIYGLNWDGGSRHEYAACTLNGKSKSGIAAKINMPHPMNNPYEGLKIEIPRGAIVVQGGTFMGKPSRLRVYVHPADFATVFPDVANRIGGARL